MKLFLVLLMLLMAVYNGTNRDIGQNLDVQLRGCTLSPGLHISSSSYSVYPTISIAKKGAKREEIHIAQRGNSSHKTPKTGTALANDRGKNTFRFSRLENVVNTQVDRRRTTQLMSQLHFFKIA
ncbi:hypothetical protein E3N88_43845 [Mikania micrantha]|uniref:Uncharacterized protein n=1 Tax=Mikania micrantha TaxID=192012 RepID=A0A5N6LDR9_9ASTR|nr:hypothetical protein E3N88_43845 [Mikania micrantha]